MASEPEKKFHKANYRVAINFKDGERYAIDTVDVIREDGGFFKVSLPGTWTYYGENEYRVNMDIVAAMAISPIE